ncbi:tRNA-splicing endonuclease, subunit Sen54 [Artemisia annua]|uniref:tRNA-splicing endonuclease, subunit Sen54 n=1 Tax=Artemisia annua TaxID=35608 RepID=A0A2U1NH11_ARTAN|nr:tRNA-splicing endonuclease, subunit Sen54 [Artemisia annua]
MFQVSWIHCLLAAVFVSICFVMKTEDWDVASYGGSSDSDVTSPDSDNEDRCYAFGDLPKLQFRKDPSKARWKEELGMAVIVSNKGRMLTTAGISRGGKIYIFLEDILQLVILGLFCVTTSRFLAEIGALHLLDDEDKCIPLENIYKKVAAGLGGSSWETFEIYRHVKSLGYIIKRHGVCWSHKRCKTVPAFLVGESGSQTITENGTEDIDSINEISELFSTMKINDMRPVFDVYPPSSKFRKSSPGNPMFILCVNSGNPPTKKHIEDLEGKCEGIPLKICYVEHGRLVVKIVDLILSLRSFIQAFTAKVRLEAEVKRFLMLELRSNRLQDFCNASISISLPNSPSSSQASPTPQDKWSREKHTKLVNIVGEPSAGMLTRQMSKGLSVASASE